MVCGGGIISLPCDVLPRLPHATQVTTSSPTPSNTPSVSPSGTPTPSSGVAIATNLLIELHAEDFVSATGLWDNRVTAGAVSLANGDFTTMTVPNSAPSTGYVLGAPAVTFNVTATGYPQFVVANPAYASFAGLYGAWAGGCVRLAMLHVCVACVARRNRHHRRLAVGDNVRPPPPAPPLQARPTGPTRRGCTTRATRGRARRSRRSSR
jgi:hypothetical protein